MSDAMLLGVLRMPHELAMADELSRSQCWSRASEAADRIESDAARIAELAAENVKLRGLHYAVGTTDVRDLPAEVRNACGYGDYYRDRLSSQAERIDDLESALKRILRLCKLPGDTPTDSIDPLVAATINGLRLPQVGHRTGLTVEELEARLAKYEQPDDNEPVTGGWLRSIGFRRNGILPHGHTFVVDQLGGDAWVSVTIETGASSLDIGSVYGGLTFVRPNPTRGQVRRLIAALKGEP